MTRAIGVAIVPDVGAAIVPDVDAGEPDAGRWLDWPEAIATLRQIEADERPRWVWWPHDTARALIAAGIRPARCWDLGAVHRMLVGGWRTSPSAIWATCHDLDLSSAPQLAGAPDLFSDHERQVDPGDPLDRSGHLSADWAAGSWRAEPRRAIRWAALAVECSAAQQDLLAHLPDPATALNTVYSESAAELLCAELEHDGLPIDLTVAESLIGGFIGPRPADAGHAATLAAERDELVLRHIPVEQRLDLRNPANVKALLRRVGIEVSDTRAWRLEELRDAHPFVDDLLVWRKAERVSTTFGYGWLDANVGPDGRLRGGWSASDGAAGRMTATAGLHNLPADLRPAIAAEPGFVFVRADLGQIEPRIL
ncbi:MAG: DNA polymerase I, partial [Ilumatobacteraceae bacterium]